MTDAASTRIDGEPKRTLVVVNPTAGGGRGRKVWSRLEADVCSSFGPCDVRLTSRPGEARTHASSASTDGFARVLCVGGDGTLHDVVDGLLASSDATSVAVGLIPAGTGSDFARGLSLAGDPGQLVRAQAASRGRRIDVLRVIYATPSGSRSCATINIASTGVSGQVDLRVARISPLLPGTLRYFLASLGALFGEPVPRLRVRLDGQDHWSGASPLVAVGNGRCFGGGMAIAPSAVPDDGLAELVILAGQSPWSFLRLAPAIYAGSHLTRPNVRHAQGRLVEIDADDAGSVPVDLDGESPGTLPMTVRVLPSALEILF